MLKPFLVPPPLNPRLQVLIQRLLMCAASDDPFFLVAQLNIQWWHVNSVLTSCLHFSGWMTAEWRCCSPVDFIPSKTIFILLCSMNQRPLFAVPCTAFLICWLYNNLALYGRLTHSFHTKYLICVSIKIHFIISAGPMRSAALMYFFCLCNHPFTVCDVLCNCPDLVLQWSHRF